MTQMVLHIRYEMSYTEKNINDQYTIQIVIRCSYHSSVSDQSRDKRACYPIAVLNLPFFVALCISTGS